MQANSFPERAGKHLIEVLLLLMVPLQFRESMCAYTYIKYVKITQPVHFDIRLLDSCQILIKEGIHV